MKPIQHQVLPSESELNANVQAQSASRVVGPLMTHPASIKTMLSDPPTRKGTIGILPPEIQDEIFSKLSCDAIINLTSVNKWYQVTINPKEYGTNTEQHEIFHRQEQKDRFCIPEPGKSFFACLFCWRLQPEEQFDVLYIIGPFAKGAPCWNQRKCLDCFAKGRRYQLGQRIANGAGKTSRLCRQCCAFRCGLFCTACSPCERCMEDAQRIDRCPYCNQKVLEPIENFLKGEPLSEWNDRARIKFWLSVNRSRNPAN